MPRRRCVTHDIICHLACTIGCGIGAPNTATLLPRLASSLGTRHYWQLRLPIAPAQPNRHGHLLGYFFRFICCFSSVHFLTLFLSCHCLWSLSPKATNSQRDSFFWNATDLSFFCFFGCLAVNLLLCQVVDWSGSINLKEAKNARRYAAAARARTLVCRPIKPRPVRFLLPPWRRGAKGRETGRPPGKVLCLICVNVTNEQIYRKSPLFHRRQYLSAMQPIEAEPR